MKKIYKIIFILLVGLFSFLSCSKEEENNTINLNGGEIFRYQAVTIILNGVDISQNEYIGVFAGEQVRLKKSGINTLVFSVSPNTPLGKTELVISSLNNATVKYEVKDTVLTDTPENTLSTFIGNLNSYSSQVSSSTFPEYQTAYSLISAFNSFYSDADAEQKDVMAKLYKANKASFDYILTSGINGVMDRFTPTNFATVALDLFEASVAGVVVGVVVINVADWLVSNPAIFTAVKIVGAVLAGVALGLCAESLRDFLVAKAKAVKLSISNLFGDNDRNVNNTFVSFQNDMSLTVPINTYRRSVDMTDAGSENILMSLFFSTHSIYTSTLNTINGAIDYINDYNPFYDIPNLIIRNVASVSQSEQEIITSEVFQKLNFSVNHPNLQLVSSSLQSDGQLNMKIKIIGTPTVLPVESFLNYTYSDDFSSFSGKLPIEVSNTVPREINYTIDGVSYNAPLTHIQNSDTSTCAMRLMYDNTVENVVLDIFIGNYFVNQPIGTVFQFQWNDQYLGFSTLCAGNYTRMDLAFYDSQGSAIYPWRESLTGRGTLTKTGANSFSFSGEVASIEAIPGNPNQSYVNETTTVQISGSGTF